MASPLNHPNQDITKNDPANNDRVIQTRQRPAAPLAESERTHSFIISYDGPTALTYRYAPFSPDLLVNTVGYDELDKMLTLAPYSAAMSVLVDAVLYKHWSIKPPEGLDEGTQDHALATEIARAANWHFNNITDLGDYPQSIRDVCEEHMFAIHHGFSVMEIEYRLVEDELPPFIKDPQIGFSRFSYKRCKQIGWDLDQVSIAPRGLTNNTPYSGGAQVNIPLEKCLLYKFRPMNAFPHGRGVARELYKAYKILDNLYRKWAIALEIHAIPHYRVTGPTGDNAMAKSMQQTVDAIRLGATAIFPEGYTVELDSLDGQSLLAIENAVKYYSEAIYMSILGQTLTTQQGSGNGAYALGAVHQATQDYILKHIRQSVEWNITRQVLHRWVRYNYGPKCLHLCPRFDLGNWDAKDNQMLAQAIATMITSGAVYSGEPFIRELLGFPPADADTEKKLETQREIQQKMLQQKSEPKDNSDPGGGDRGGDGE